MSFISRILNIGPICSKRVLVLKKKEREFSLREQTWLEGRYQCLFTRRADAKNSSDLIYNLFVLHRY